MDDTLFSPNCHVLGIEEYDLYFRPVSNESIKYVIKSQIL